MGHAKSSVQQQQEKRKQFELKLAVAQKIIRKKFKKAISNRRTLERNANQVMRASPTTKTIDSNSFEHNKSSSENYITNPPIESEKITSNNPNDLCNRLKILLATSNVSDERKITEKNAIISKLHELNLLV